MVRILSLREERQEERGKGTTPETPFSSPWQYRSWETGENDGQSTHVVADTEVVDFFGLSVPTLPPNSGSPYKAPMITDWEGPVCGSGGVTDIILLIYCF